MAENMIVGHKLITFLFILFLQQIQIIHAWVPIENVTKEWNTRYKTFGNDLIISSNNNLFRVVNARTQNEDYSMYIDSAYPTEANVSCIFPSAGSQNVSAVVLGNGKIVAWSKSPNEPSIKLIHIINTTDCTNKTIKFDYDVLTIFPYNNTFDVLDGTNHCMKDGTSYDGCMFLFNEEGNIIETLSVILFYYGSEDRHFDLFKKYNPENGYYVIRLIQSGSTRIDTFGRDRSTFLENAYKEPYRFIKAHSAAHDNFSLCYTRFGDGTGQNQILHCDLLDQKFKLKASVTDIEGYNGDITSIKMHNLMNGGAIVAYAVPEFPEGISYIYYRVIGANGEVGKENILVDKIYSDVVDVYIFEESAINKSYCIVWSYYKNVSGKCINL